MMMLWHKLWCFLEKAVCYDDDKTPVLFMLKGKVFSVMRRVKSTYNHFLAWDFG